jgi:UDP-N-acetylglucosamine 2-epimerase (non-hydrolysing)
VADLHFAPTDWARQNLLNEGVLPEQVILTGNPVIDALKTVSGLPPSAELKILLRQLDLAEEIPLISPRLVLVTAHRRENFGEPLKNICSALRSLAEYYGDAIRIVYPVHMNPNVQDVVSQQLGDVPNINLLTPLNYLPLVQLIQRATLVLTDSGGIQEEAPGLGVPVLVLRQVTERPEGVSAGTVRLVGTDRDTIVRETRHLLDDQEAYQHMAKAVNPYGDGHAAQRIVRALLDYQS